MSVPDQTPEVPDPLESWPDPVLLLEEDPAMAYRVIEDLLLSPRRLEFWSQWMEVLAERAPAGTDTNPPDVPEHTLSAIATMGSPSAAELRLLTPESAVTLLHNPRALSDLHVRVMTSDEPYWQHRRSEARFREWRFTSKQTAGSSRNTRQIIEDSVRFLREHARIVAVIALMAAVSGAGFCEVLVSERLHRATEQRRRAEQAQQAYEAAWGELRFDEVVRPVIRVLSADPGAPPNRVRVELSPRTAEGLVRSVDIRWGDTGDHSERVYEATGPIQRFEAVHDYVLPQDDQTLSWTLLVLYTVPDAVEKARRLVPEQLTSTCLVTATADGLRLEPVKDQLAPTPQLAASEHPEIAWVSPRPEQEVGWKTTVEILSRTPTERVTLLVRHKPGTTFYVQAGARPLSPAVSEPFDVWVGTGASREVGEDFDILAVCSDGFRPKDFSLEIQEVPLSSVVSRITVRKVSGQVYLDDPAGGTGCRVRAKGVVYTGDGGALLLERDDGSYRVLELIPPQPAGGPFDVELALESGRHRSIRLLVCRESAPKLKVDQVLSSIGGDAGWLYETTQDPSHSNHGLNEGGVQ